MRVKTINNISIIFSTIIIVTFSWIMKTYYGIRSIAYVSPTFILMQIILELSIHRVVLNKKEDICLGKVNWTWRRDYRRNPILYWGLIIVFFIAIELLMIEILNPIELTIINVLLLATIVVVEIRSKKPMELYESAIYVNGYYISFEELSMEIYGDTLILILPYGIFKDLEFKVSGKENLDKLGQVIEIEDI